MNILKLDQLLTALKENKIEKLRIFGCDDVYRNPVPFYRICFDKNAEFNVPKDPIHISNIFERLQFNSSLKSIIFYHVYVDEQMLRQISKMISYNTVETLILEMCKIESKFELLIEPISVSTSLKTISFSWDNITPDIILSFFKAIASNTTLQTAKFGHNALFYGVNDPAENIEYIKYHQEQLQTLTPDQQLVVLEKIKDLQMSILTWSLDEYLADCLKDNFTLTNIIVLRNQPLCNKLLLRNKIEIEKSRFKKTKPVQ